MFRLSRIVLILTVTIAGVLPLSEAGEPATEPTTLTFFAYDHDAKGHIVGRSGVSCLALRADGTRILGKTSADGELTLNYVDLFSPENLALLFCSPSDELRCSAIRLDVPHLRGFAQYNVRVTAPEIICREEVSVPTRGQRR